MTAQEGNAVANGLAGEKKCFEKMLEKSSSPGSFPQYFQ